MTVTPKVFTASTPATSIGNNAGSQSTVDFDKLSVSSGSKRGRTSAMGPKDTGTTKIAGGLDKAAPRARDKPGALLAQLPARDRAAPYTERERDARWEAAKIWSFNAPDADRFMDLERVRLTLGKGTKKYGYGEFGQLGIYAEELANRLTSSSSLLAESKAELARLEKEGGIMANVPFSPENDRLNKARARVKEDTDRLHSFRAEVDKFLNKPDTFKYLKPINPVKDGNPPKSKYFVKDFP